MGKKKKRKTTGRGEFKKPREKPFGTNREEKEKRIRIPGGREGLRPKKKETSLNLERKKRKVENF